MLPNLVWMALPKGEASDQVAVPLPLAIAENIGRVAVLALPIFMPLDLSKRFSVLAITAMGAALAIYYAAWIRYFAGEREASLMAAPLLGIPLPLAVTPTVLLLLSAYLMNSWLMLGASIWFGTVHIWVSALSLSPGRIQSIDEERNER